MRTIPQHLDNIREKPHHVRRQVAFVFAAVLTGVVGLVWLGGSLATGAFALKGANFAQMTGAESPDTTGETGNTGVAGAAAALPDDSGPARIKVIPTKPPQTTQKPNAASPGSSTIIPF